MDADQRRQEVARRLDEDPSVSQWAIAKQLGVSQKTISRDMAALGRVSVNEFATRAANKAGLQPESRLLSGCMTRGDSLVARLRGEMADRI